MSPERLPPRQANAASSPRGQDRHGELDPHRGERRALGGIVVAPGDERLERRGAPGERHRERAVERERRAHRGAARVHRREGAARARVDRGGHELQDRRDPLAEQTQHVRAARALGELAAQALRLEREDAPLGIHAVLDRAIDAAQDRERGAAERDRQAQADSPWDRPTCCAADAIAGTVRKPSVMSPMPITGEIAARRDQPVDVQQVEARERDEQTDRAARSRARAPPRTATTAPARRAPRRPRARRDESDVQADQHPLQLAAPDRPAGAVALHEPRAEHRDGRDLERERRLVRAREAERNPERPAGDDRARSRRTATATAAGARAARTPRETPARCAA